MFIDRARIYVEGGRGGNGAVAFRREKYVPRGGPDGGGGGRGGDVWLVVDPGLNTLLEFRRRQHFKAGRGEHGSGGNKTGRDGEDLVVRVPPGTAVYDDETGELVADLVRPGQRFLAARGGRGGRGNASFASPSHQAPRFAERGEPGEAYWYRLELKLLADVGLVGYPNAGKSTLLSRVTAARPKVAPYPFTTLEPYLGVVNLGEGEGFVLADIPGLIEGAHAGAGLGHEFLRHVERTLLLIHVVDGSGLSGRDPWEDFLHINEELRLFNPELAQKPQVVAINKVDLAEARAQLPALAERLAGAGFPFVPISAATGEGIPQLLQAVRERLQPLRQRLAEELSQRGGEEVLFRPPAPATFALRVRREGETFILESPEVERLVAMTDLENPEALRFFQRALERRGVLAALQEAGVRPGDTVRVGQQEFEFTENLWGKGREC